MPGEVVRARKSLSGLREDIVESAKERSVIQDETEFLKSQKHSLFREVTLLGQEKKNLEIQIEAKNKELGILESVADGKRYVVIMLDESVEESALSLSEVEWRTQDMLNQLSVLELERNSLEKDTEGKRILRERFEGQVRALVGEKISLEHAVARLMAELTKAVEKKEGVEGAIEDALKNFRVFEKRISRLSEETGYMVGYTRPDSLLDNDETYG